MSTHRATDHERHAEGTLSRPESRAIVVRLRSSGRWRQLRDVLRPRGLPAC